MRSNSWLVDEATALDINLEYGLVTPYVVPFRGAYDIHENTAAQGSRQSNQWQSRPRVNTSILKPPHLSLQCPLTDDFHITPPGGICQTKSHVWDLE